MFKLVVLTLIVLISSQNSEARNAVLNKLRSLNKLEPARRLIEKAGYHAISYDVPTQPGYMINLINIVNPELDASSAGHKGPVLFVHGFLTSATEFLFLGSRGHPSDWSHINLNELHEDELQSIMVSDIASKSLPLLMSNLGYDVWVINRRPTVESFIASTKARLRGPAHQWAKQPVVEDKHTWKIIDKLLEIPMMLFNRKWASFWDFSFDEQAQYDLPIAIDFILGKSKFEKLHLIGHSAGGQLILMLLSYFPEYASKVNHASLLAPSFNLASNKFRYGSDLDSFRPLEHLFRSTVGPTSAPALLPLYLLIKLYRCLIKTIEFEVCTPSILEDVLGNGVNQLKIPFEAVSLVAPVSTHELAQLLQSMEHGLMRLFDYGSKKNLQIYGQLDPPRYKLEDIELENLAIWQGNSDTLVRKDDTRTVAENMKVHPDYHIIANDTTKDALVNHAGLVAHENVISLVNIPVLKRLEKIIEHVESHQ